MSTSVAAGGCLAEADLDRREAVCRALLESAGGLAMEGFQSLGQGADFDMKGPQDYLTKYDGLVEEHIRSRLNDEFPDDGFLGEESGAQLAPRLWVVDPIDGTANFARGIPHFAVSIAFLDQGRVELGGIANPATAETYFSRRGRGASRNGRPIQVASTRSMERASVEFGWSTRVANAIYMEALSAILESGANVRRSASGSLGIAYVADGRSDAYVELHINAWDCLAGLLIVQEAGGVVSPFLVGEGLANGNPVLAAAPGIVEVMSKATGILIAGTVEQMALPACREQRD